MGTKKMSGISTVVKSQMSNQIQKKLFTYIRIQDKLTSYKYVIST